MQDAYHFIYKLIEWKVPSGEELFNSFPIRGRITTPGLYMTYWLRGLRAGQ